MNEMSQEQTAVIEFLLAPPTEWEELWEGMTPYQQARLADQLDGYCVWAARAASYAETMRNGGEHADAVKAQNKTAAKVRKALGFTYPKQDIQF